MRDHVTEERISAYVDGELEGDELKLVETLLAESAEHRQLLAELQDLRASLQALPSFNLPADFHSRVVAQIEKAAVTPSPEPVLSRRESKSGPWRSVLVAVASLAALVAFTVMLRPTPTPVDDGSTLGTTPVTMPVYLRQEPVMVMVYDVTVTPAGQKRKVIDKLLQNLGIGIDPALRLDSDLEKSLTAYRSPPGLEDQAQATPYKDPTAPKVADENVEIIYVASLVNVLDQFYLDLFRMQEAGDEVTRVRTDLVFEPNKLGVMHRLHESAREHFAHRSNVPPSDRGEAFHISFRLKLTSVSGTIMLPVPTIIGKSASSDQSLEPAILDSNADGAISRAKIPGTFSQGGGEGGSLNGGFDKPNRPNPDNMEPGHILLIIRNVGAKADEAE